jgi:hypothetical protein
MSALGPAMIFMCLVVLETLVGIVVLSFAARCFGVVVEQTAAGADAVTWPDEPMQDWLGRAVHLVWLVAFWLAPVALLLRLLRVLIPGGSPIVFFLPPVVLFWLLFPVSVLSSFSAVSRWVVFRPAVLRGLFRLFPATAAFYLLSALLVGGLGGLAFLAFVQGWALLIPLLAVVAATGLFIYARLLGRLGGQLHELEPPEPEEPAPTPERPPARPRPRNKRRPVRGVKTVDPWAVPEEEEEPPEPKPKEEVYGVASTDVPPPEPKRQKRPRPRPYAVSSEEPPPPPAEVPLDGYPAVGEESSPARQREEAKTNLPAAPGRGREPPPRPERPKPPAHPFLEGVYTFPWYPTSAKAWLALTGGLLAMGGILQAMIAVAAGLGVG